MSWPANPGARLFKGTADGSPSLWEEDPIETIAAVCHLKTMSLLLVLLVPLLLFGGGGFCLGGSVGGLIGLILLICLILHFTGGFRTKSNPPAATLSRDMQSSVSSGVKTP
jgi:hypothetical protein